MDTRILSPQTHHQQLFMEDAYRNDQSGYADYMTIEEKNERFLGWVTWALVATLVAIPVSLYAL